MNNPSRLILCLIFMMLFTLASYADEQSFNVATSHQMAGKYYNYPYLLQEPPLQTPAPQGYIPFHIEHYGRHGSRWHVGYKYFDQAYRILDKAHEDGKLTLLGERTYQAIKQIKEIAHRGHSGELTEIGALQHQAIGRRMVLNFPSIFSDSAIVNARSTVVIRAILSMHNSLDAIRSLRPNLKILSEASAADMWYLYYQDEEAKKIRNDKKRTILSGFNDRHSNKGQYLDRLIKDKHYSSDSIGDKLFNPLFYALINCQSHSNQPWLIDSIFSIEEIHEQWLQGNAEWFLEGGNSSLTNNRMPFSQANLLQNIITSSDSAFTSSNNSINLRYGHDSALLPLIVLMEINDFGLECNNLEELSENGWHDYLMVPMAANIQIIFYHKPQLRDKDSVIVKVLLNEEEVKLPIGHLTGPYYNWKVLRDYYLEKITPFITEPHLQKEIKHM